MMWQYWRQRLAALFELSKLRRRRQKPARYVARFEPLESRRVLSANTIAILPASLTEGNSGTALMSFVATRTGDLNSVVTVEYQTSNGTATSPSDYTATTGNVTFGVGQSSAAVTVPIVGDTTGEDNETFQVSLTRVVNTTGANASFGSATNFTANTTVKGIVLADLNGDGRPEAIAINNGSDNLSIFRNTASPGASTASFAAKQDVSTQADPISIATGDLNGDGRLDLIVGNDASANVSVFLNTTTPGGTTFTFAPAIEFNAASQPRALTVADVNLDGKADVIFTAQSANVVGVLLNTTQAGATTASLATAQTFATPASPVGVASADLNGDGLRDLVVVSSGADSASVFLNNTTVNSSTVQWQTRRDFATGAVPSALALADLNGDGRADIVVTNAVGDNVSVLVNETATGNATAAFAAAANFASGNTPRAVALADLNGDGTLDLLVAHQDDQTVTALINRTTRGAGTISLSAAVNTTVGTQPYAIAVGDLNGDGKPDVVSGNALSDNISAIINQALWDSTAPTLQTSSVTAATTAQGLASGDLNGDGKPDLIAAMPGSNALGIFVNSSAGGAASPSFAARQDVALGATPGAVHLADVNSDGKLDAIVTTTPNLVTVLLNTTPAGSASISFAASPTTVTLAGLGAEITSGDLN
ncbi:MAG: VCBS repeat-containing protein, partial [Planctomycetaceae bacterium]|nr:VCBS repeat-containing protein [Planctomycetaceae bacterium]